MSILAQVSEEGTPPKVPVSWFVFPCRNKIPLTPHGFKDATTDATQIAAWAKQYPGCEWGVDCGRSHLAVLDIDSQLGEDWFQSARGEEPIETPTAITPSGWKHIYFGTNGATVPSRKLFGDDAELKANGGYVILPGTPGREWLLDPEEVEVQELPAWLRAAQSATRVATPSAGEPIPEGQRNSVLTSLAGTMRRRGMTPDAITAALMAENAVRCEPPLANSEVEVIAASVARYTPDDKPTDWIGQGFDVLQAVERPPAREYLVHGLLRDVATTLLVGDYAHHKSNLQMAIGLCVALGRDFAGLTTQQRPVILVCQDQSRERILEVAHAMMSHYGQPMADAFKVFSYPLPPLSLIGDLAPFEEVVAGVDRPLLLINSLSACAGTEEENGTEIARAVRMLDALRSRHAGTAMMTHHTPHGQEHARGNRLIVAAVEYSMVVKRDNRPDGDFISFVAEKTGSAPLLKDLVLRFTYEAYPESAQMRHAGFDRAKETDAAPLHVVEDAEEARAFVKEHGLSSGRDIRRPKKEGGLGWNGVRTGEATKYAQAAGWLRRDPEELFFVPDE